MAQLARRSATARTPPHEARAGYWRNLVDPSDHFIRPRNSDGSWANPTEVGDPTGVTGVSTVLAPVAARFPGRLSGGHRLAVPVVGAAGRRRPGRGDRRPAVALRRLDRFFSTALNSAAGAGRPARRSSTVSFFGVYYVGDQYTPANEPDLWAPWYYDWLGQPWKTQKVARAEMGAYNPTPDGLPGNDDAGEMSAWYVLAALGLYHATPGVHAWELSSPAFPRAAIPALHLTIDAPGASNARPYVDGLALDGQPVTRTFLASCELRAGGRLSFELGVTARSRLGDRTGRRAAVGERALANRRQLRGEAGRLVIATLLSRGGAGRRSPRKPARQPRPTPSRGSGAIRSCSPTDGSPSAGASAPPAR